MGCGRLYAVMRKTRLKDDTYDRIVSNDTRYISLNGSWWRESGMNTTYTVKHIQKGLTLFIKEVVG